MQNLSRMVPVEPGINLVTDVYLPDGPGRFPVVLLRTPYLRTRYTGTAARFVARGFGFVVQDVRGRWGSDGVFVPLVHEAADGYATIDWIANQAWCNGRVGTWGQSYPGIVQVPAAAVGHEALRCIAPSVAPASFFTDWIRYDGCYALANTIRYALTRTGSRTNPAAEDEIGWDKLYQLGDLDSIFTTSGLEAPILRTWAGHDHYDTYWEEVDQHLLHPRIGVPGFHVGGWFDHISRGQVEAYTNIKDSGATEGARSGQRLLVGPWGHTTLGQTTCGEWDFGPSAALAPLVEELQFFDFHLGDLDNGYTTTPPVRVFVMGANRWQAYQDWPPPEAEDQDWYLGSTGNARTHHGDGILAQAPSPEDREDSYTYDPRNPVPTHGGPIYRNAGPWGPLDQRTILARPDILCYRSTRLEGPITVVGEPRIDLVISATSEDTDIIAKLCVEEPNGKVVCLTVGSLRCRYRDSMADPKPLERGEPTPIQVRLNPTAYVYPRNSRIVVLITSSDFPRINPHPNTMAPPLSGEHSQAAQVTIYHGPTPKSCLHIPTIPAEWR